MAYLDSASGEPPHPAGLSALAAALEDGWADPSRLHRQGRRARLLLDAARDSMASSLGVRADEIVLATSGSHAVQLGVLGAVGARRRSGSGVVVSAVEHSSVLHAADAAAAAGDSAATGAGTGAAAEARAVRIGVDARGRVDVDAYAAAVAADGVALACLQSANQEVGTRQPLEAVASECADAGVPLLVDAAVTIGREPVPAGWDLLTASAHKWGGPAGVGVLVVRTGTRWAAPLPAAGAAAAAADRAVPGFPDVPAAVAAAAALEAVLADSAVESARLHGLTALVREQVAANVPDVEVVGDPDDRAPHVVTFSCLYVAGEAVVTELDRLGLSVSSGSACSSDTLEPSHVLAAMGALTHGNVRVSLPRGVDESDVHRFVDALPGVVAGLRAQAGAAGL